MFHVWTGYISPPAAALLRFSERWVSELLGHGGRRCEEAGEGGHQGGGGQPLHEGGGQPHGEGGGMEGHVSKERKQ